MIVPDNVTVADYSDAIALEEVSHARVTFIMDNIVYQDEELYQGGIVVSTYMNPATNMRFGTAYSTEVTILFMSSDKTERTDFSREFTLEFGVDINGVTEWVLIGHFSGKSISQGTQDTLELVAYDKMPRFDRSVYDFVSSLSFPTTLGQIYDDLCEFCVINNTSGDEIEDVMSRTVADLDNLDELGIVTCRDLLSMIAEANGCYARMTNEGFLQLKWFTDCTSAQELIRDNCFSYRLNKLEKSYSTKWGSIETLKWKDVESVQYSEYDNNSNPFDFSNISASWDDPWKEVVQPPTDEYFNHRVWANVENYLWENVEPMQWKELEQNGDIAGSLYRIENNPFLMYDTDEEIKTHLQYIMDRLINFHLYYVATVTMVGNWLIEPGDIVMLEVSDGTFTTYPIFNRVLSWNGSCTCEYETTGSLSAS